jgi:transcriptional regulator with XRE-family HTH domain
VRPSFGAVLRQAREVRGLSGIDAAKAAGISAAYLSKLESDAVKRPSPHVLLQLGEALAVPYAELMRLSGYQVPGESDATPGDTVGAALFADLTDDERDELLEYLAWYRARRRSGRGMRRALGAGSQVV